MKKKEEKPVEKKLSEFEEYEEGQYGTEEMKYENQEEMDVWSKKLISKIPFVKR